jgi:ribosomal subunit interface protein
MHLDIACHHTTLTPSMRVLAEEKFTKLSSHTKDPLNVHLVLTVDGSVHRAEATIAALRAKLTPIHGVAESENMYSAIDALVHILDRRLRKQKTSLLRASRGKVSGINGHDPV